MQMTRESICVNCQINITTTIIIITAMGEKERANQAHKIQSKKIKAQIDTQVSRVGQIEVEYNTTTD